MNKSSSQLKFQGHRSLETMASHRQTEHYLKATSLDEEDSFSLCLSKEEMDSDGKMLTASKAFTML